MKKLLFDGVAVTIFWLIQALDFTLRAIVRLESALVALLRIGAAKLGVALMIAIDKQAYEDTIEEALAAEEMEQQTTELELLSNATKLKEHALETGEWTDDHSEALNAIGNALLNDCDWDEDDIHRYLKEVVESGTGLSYERGEGDEYDD